MSSQSQKGFTLVELSIVLVIIGLLIGGILVAQSMIKTTKVQATIRQIGQFDAAVGNFIDKFKGVPGDVTAYGGDGDGIIEMVTGGGITEFKGEIGRFWNDLSVSGLSTDAGGTDTYDSAAAGTSIIDISGTDANAPALKAGGNGSSILAFGSAAAVNWYHILNMGATATGGSGVLTEAGAPTLAPADALAIDSKMDDGVGSSGNVQATAVDDTNGLGDAPVAGCFTGGVYVVATTTNVCELKIRMGSQIGYLQ